MDGLNIDKVFESIEGQEEDSKLGFFSKPYRIVIDQEEVIAKVYHPTKKDASLIAQLHDDYKLRLANTGVKLPPTNIYIAERKGKQVLVILQRPFAEAELLRNEFEAGSLEEVLHLLKLIFDDTLLFWKNKPVDSELGFHPTLRNYARHQGSLYYFDTFPPMNMDQETLNKIIVKMAPLPSWIKPLVPLKAINRVSDEYYSVVKMIVGIVGSSCRLRPTYAQEILSATKEYIEVSDLTAKEKKEILTEIAIPPKLPFIWTWIRKITGNVGKPNITPPQSTPTTEGS